MGLVSHSRNTSSTDPRSSSRLASIRCFGAHARIWDRGGQLSKPPSLCVTAATAAAASDGRAAAAATGKCSQSGWNSAAAQQTAALIRHLPCHRRGLEWLAGFWRRCRGGELGWASLAIDWPQPQADQVQPQFIRSHPREAQPRPRRGLFADLKAVEETTIGPRAEPPGMSGDSSSWKGWAAVVHRGGTHGA